jgi:hypothetical protein
MYNIKPIKIIKTKTKSNIIINELYFFTTPKEKEQLINDLQINIMNSKNNIIKLAYITVLKKLTSAFSEE